MLTKRQAQLIRDSIEETMEKDDKPENIRSRYSYQEFESARNLMNHIIKEKDRDE